MTLEEMKARRKELGYSYREISRRSGVPLGTVQKIFGGITSSPRMETIVALEKILAKRKEKKEYSLEDYYAIPEDRRVELIDGIIYDMAAPATDHQLISHELDHQLSNFIRENKGNCRVFVAPFDVQLDGDEKTMIQPDVMVFCNRDRITPKRAIGAPDLVIEILSQSTAYKDMFIKLVKYMKAGVKEYWIVNPENQQILVYILQGDTASVKAYSFDDHVPVGIWDNGCRIDFPDIRDQLDEWLGEE